MTAQPSLSLLIPDPNTLGAESAGVVSGQFLTQPPGFQPLLSSSSFLEQSCGAAGPAWRSGSITTSGSTLLREWESSMKGNGQGQMWHLGRWSGKASWTGCGCRKLGREHMSRPGFLGLKGRKTWGWRGAS